jgi:acetolactate synthase-1/2/3 large subunit
MSADRTRPQDLRAETLPAGVHPGGKLVAAALHTAGITHAFGIPGTHNIELYDALAGSQVRTVLITAEQSAGFLCDGFARSGGGIACANVVPGAGVTHALSGIAEAFMDGVPLLVLTCGVRNDVPFRYQLHDIDQLALLRPVTKGTFRPTRGEEIVPMLLQAVDLALSGCPGPVAVEIPANLYLLAQQYDPEPVRALLAARPQPILPDPQQVQAVAQMLRESRRPLLHVGLGAAGAADLLPELVARTGALVTSTFSGKGVVDERHPSWLWPGFGKACPEPLRAIAAECDAVLLLGARLGEVSTASYGIQLPEASAHVDVDPAVPGATFPVRIQVVADARTFVQALLLVLPAESMDTKVLQKRVADAHRKVAMELSAPSVGRVSPGALFASVQRHFPADTCYATDSGNGTFLAMEHLRLSRPRRFLAPTDFSCMGYCVPAAIGAALAHPGTPVVAFAGDGALLMTGLELLTAAHLPVPVATFVLRDGELGQIASFQRTLTHSAPCSVLPDYDLEALAAAVHVPFRRCANDAELEAVVAWARAQTAAGGPCVVEVAIDYDRKTFFSRGVVAANFGRLPWRDRVRMVSRAVARRVG